MVTRLSPRRGYPNKRVLILPGCTAPRVPSAGGIGCWARVVTVADSGWPASGWSAPSPKHSAAPASTLLRTAGTSDGGACLRSLVEWQDSPCGHKLCRRARGKRPSSSSIHWLVGGGTIETATTPRCGQPVETGTVARTYPFSAGTLTVEGGVPFGIAASAPATFTTAVARNKSRHCCC